MASFNKFYIFAEDVGIAVHDLNTDTLNVYLSNAVPSQSADAVKTDLLEITQENGYPGGQGDIANAYSHTAGVGTLTGTDVTFTASGGSFGPFQYIVLFNLDTAVKVDPLIGWWDYGSAISVNDGESFTVDFGASVLTIT